MIEWMISNPGIVVPLVIVLMIVIVAVTGWFIGVGFEDWKRLAEEEKKRKDG